MSQHADKIISQTRFFLQKDKKREFATFYNLKI